MCFNSESSSQANTTVNDERFNVEAGGIGFRGDSVAFDINNENLNDDVAQFAIESSTNALTESTDFLQSAFTEIINLTDSRLARADDNLSTQNATAAELLRSQQEQASALIAQESESSDQRLIEIFKLGIVAGIAVFAIRSGAIKDITGAFK